MSDKRRGLRQEDHDPAELRRALDAAKRTDLATFIETAFGIINPGVAYRHNFHIEAIAHHLEQCRRREITRLMITVPPRSLKSHCVSIAYPAFSLGNDPTRKIIAASYSSELSENLHRLFRAVVDSREYRRLFPALRVTRGTETEFRTKQNGFRYATSVGGTLTGIGGTDIIIDDPLKPEDAMSKVAREAVISWYKTTLSTRTRRQADGRDRPGDAASACRRFGRPYPPERRRPLGTSQSAGNCRGAARDCSWRRSFPYARSRRCAPS